MNKNIIVTALVTFFFVHLASARAGSVQRHCYLQRWQFVNLQHEQIKGDETLPADCPPIYGHFTSLSQCSDAGGMRQAPANTP